MEYVVGFVPSNDLEEKILAFCNEMQKRHNDSWKDHPEFFQVKVSKGKKYYKLISGRTWKDTGCQEFGSISGFIDFEGNIYKSASAVAPAKTPRGNLHINNGIEALNYDGSIRYLK